MSKDNKYYFSVIHKWLHFDKNHKKSDVREILGMKPMVYEHALEKPYDYFTITHIEKLSILLERDIAEVFYACYKKPIKDVIHDKKLVETMQALDRAGIK